LTRRVWQSDSSTLGACTRYPCGRGGLSFHRKSVARALMTAWVGVTAYFIETADVYLEIRFPSYREDRTEDYRSRWEHLGRLAEFFGTAVPQKMDDRRGASKWGGSQPALQPLLDWPKRWLTAAVVTLRVVVLSPIFISVAVLEVALFGLAARATTRGPSRPHSLWPSSHATSPRARAVRAHQRSGRRPAMIDETSAKNIRARCKRAPERINSKAEAKEAFKRYVRYQELQSRAFNQYMRGGPHQDHHATRRTVYGEFAWEWRRALWDWLESK
jgi:hypothetical protein